MPNEPFRLSRRAALLTAGAVVLAGCEDQPSSSGTAGVVNGKTGQPAGQTPSTDPVVVAALSSAATLVTQLSLRYTATSQKFPALRTQLATGLKYHASHLAKLKETAGVKAAAAGTQPAVPSTSAAALAGLAEREKAAATALAAAAAKLSGAPARLLAMIAASETQLAVTLAPKKKAGAQ